MWNRLPIGTVRAAGNAIRLPLALLSGTAVPRPNVYSELGRNRVRAQVVRPIVVLKVGLCGVGTVDDHVFFGEVAAPSGSLTVRKI